ncbi:MAG TPA: hypothetical protein VM847_11130, partial [Tahibacter sp.]|nr:hypothetical protein [Tahibacter sp.]
MVATSPDAPTPPAISTLPLGSRVALCDARDARRSGPSCQLSLAGKYSRVAAVAGWPAGVPPEISRLPSASRV